MENTIKKINKNVDKYRSLILNAERYIWNNPEIGYKEFKTSAYLEENFKKLGYDIVKADGITGFYTEIDTKSPGPKVLIFGELDSIICPDHKDADKVTGAVHSCGHNAQCATLLGIAGALKEPDALDGLSGKIMLCAIPAEELLDLEYRLKLKKEGKIKYLGGKSEFLSRGYFDGVDMAFMVHTSTEYRAHKGAVGCLTKSIIYKGKAAHAGSSPWLGCNALYSATLGINAINALRETFKEPDYIRVHPIITHGGDMVNAIPETVKLESYVRGATFEAIDSANKKVNQALIGGALSLGANIEIIDAPGYSPLKNDEEMLNIAKKAYEALCPNEVFELSPALSTGSTDMGDLSSIMPVIHPYAGGATGKAHGNDYQIADAEKACVLNAKWQLLILTMLLENNAQKANEIIKNYKPTFNSKEEFLSYMDSLNCSGDRISYNENKIAEIKL